MILPKVSQNILGHVIAKSMTLPKVSQVSQVSQNILSHDIAKSIPKYPKT
jgi:hypothetical protein